MEEVIEEYTGIKEVCARDKVSTVTVYSALRSGKPVKNCFYRYKDGEPASTYKAPSTDNQPWEDGNGMFDIDGWKTVCL